MSRPNFDRLVPPPRAVPLGLRVDALFGGDLGLTLIAWTMLLFTTPVFWGFAINAEVLAPIVLGASAARTEGRVTAMGKTTSRESKSENSVIYWVDYAYQAPAGPLLTGRSYVTGSAPDVGAKVSVEYIPSSPRFSRVVGMRRARFGPSTGLAILLPAIAAVFVVFSLSPGRRTLRLLRKGLVKDATFLYLPDEPKTWTSLANLPEVVTVDERGELAAGPGIRWAALALPLLVTLVNGACAVNYLR